MGRNGYALGWDMKRQGLDIGCDFPADETLPPGFTGTARLELRLCLTAVFSAAKVSIPGLCVFH